MAEWANSALVVLQLSPGHSLDFSKLHSTVPSNLGCISSKDILIHEIGPQLKFCRYLSQSLNHLPPHLLTSFLVCVIVNVVEGDREGEGEGEGVAYFSFSSPSSFFF